MGVYIKGMEMPTSCWGCPCHHRNADVGYYDYEICRASGTVFNDAYSAVTGNKIHIDPFKQRLDNCPLVPVPPHGRCIDADALMKRMWDETDCMISVPATFVRDAPTIIPADRGQEPT